jgi:hypothetical protein
MLARRRSPIHVLIALVTRPRFQARRADLHVGNLRVFAQPILSAICGANRPKRFIGKQFELAAAWQVTPELNLSASVSAFDPGPFIRETGAARTIKMVGAMANFRF